MTHPDEATPLTDALAKSLAGTYIATSYSKMLDHACQLELKLNEAKRKLAEVIEALEFYADPENYHAITVIADRPSGAFADDFSADHGHEFYDRPMPGKLARDVLFAIAQEGKK